MPNAFTARVQRLVSAGAARSRHDAKEDWPGWDVVRAFLPRSELHDLIVELRSLTLGVGSFAHRFDHLQESTGRTAEIVIKSRREEAAQYGYPSPAGGGDRSRSEQGEGYGGRRTLLRAALTRPSATLSHKGRGTAPKDRETVTCPTSVPVPKLAPSS